MIHKKYHVSMINMDIMCNIFGNNPRAIHDYLESFVSISRKLLEKAAEAIKKKDMQSAIDYFHQIKGPVGSIEFKKMYRLCEKAEKKVAQSEWDVASQCNLEIEEILKKLQLELESKFKDI